MHCNNFSPTIYINPIYSFIKAYWREYRLCLLGLVVTARLHCAFSLSLFLSPPVLKTFW